MIKTFLYWLTGKLPAREINGKHDEPYLERYFLFGTYIHNYLPFVGKSETGELGT